MRWLTYLGRRRDGFTYVLYINGGHPPWSALDYVLHCCQLALLLNPWRLTKVKKLFVYFQLFVYFWFSLQDGAAQGRHRLAPPPPPRAPGRPELRRGLLVAQGQVGLRVPERCSLLMKWILLAKGTIH